MPNIERAILREYKDVEVGFSDGRTISARQRRAIYALINEIADYVGDDVESQKQVMKMDFVLTRMQAVQRKLFSLSNVDITTANEFQNYLIEFIVKNDIPTKISLIENCSDVGKFVYVSLMARKCAVCGAGDAHIHHCEGSRIGAGNDRDKVHHLGREVLPLCAKHHDECHHDEAGFIERYHLQKVKLDEPLCKRLKLKK